MCMCQKDKSSNKKWIRNVFPVTGSDPDAAHPANYLINPAFAHAVPAFSLLSPASGVEEKTTPCFCKLAPQSKPPA